MIEFGESAGGGGGGSGTVTRVSVSSANGFAGSVINPSTTPAITLSVTITGILKGNGTTISAATAGTDYVAPGGALGTPSSGNLANCTFPTLNQNTTGSAGSVANALTTGTGLSGSSFNGSAAVSWTLGAAYGDSINPYASKTANFMLAAPNGSSGVPTFRAIVAADVPTLNQNTTGSAGSVTSSLTAGTGLSGSSFNGSAATSWTLNAAYGDSINPYASKSANLILAAPNGSSGVPTFRALAISDLPSTITLTQAPAAPASGDVSLGVVTLGALEVPAYQGAHGTLQTMQKSLGRGSWGLAIPPYNTGTFNYSGIFASGLFTSVGSGVASALTGTNYGNSQSRAGLSSVTTAGSIAGLYNNSSTIGMFTVGTGSGLGGGQAILRFWITDTVAAPLMFAGLSASTAAPSATTDPATLLNIIGVGVSQSVANPSHLYLFYGGSSSQTPIDLDPSGLYPVTSSSTYFYEVIISSDPVTGTTAVTLNVYTTSAVPVHSVTQTLTNTTPGTTLPASTSGLGPRIWRSNNATAAAVIPSIQSMYVTGQT